MSGHAILAPSSSSQWVKCHGFIPVAGDVASPKSIASSEGDAAHWVGFRILSSYRTPGSDLVSSASVINHPDPAGTIITDEMWQGANLYAGEVLSVCNQTGLLQSLHVEETVYMPEIHPDCWGTPDAWAYDHINNVLYIWDFKFGHRRVEVFENWQLICYAIGVLNALFGGHEKSLTLVLKVVQPRCYDGRPSVTDWTLNSIELRPYINILHNAAHANANRSAHPTAGSHCRDCRGAHVCPALRDAAANVIDHAGDAIPHVMTNEGVSYELTKMREAKVMFEARLDAIEAEAMHRINDGARLPGWMTQQGYGQNKWTESVETIQAIGELFNVNVMEEPKLASPAQVNKRLKERGIDESVISSYYKKPLSSVKLVPDDGSKARQVFSKGGFHA